MALWIDVLLMLARRHDEAAVGVECRIAVICTVGVFVQNVDTEAALCLCGLQTECQAGAVVPTELVSVKQAHGRAYSAGVGAAEAGGFVDRRDADAGTTARCGWCRGQDRRDLHGVRVRVACRHRSSTVLVWTAG